MRTTRAPLVFLSLLLLVIAPLGAHATQQVVLNHFGHLYETGGFPSSNPGDVLAGVGFVTSAPLVNCDLVANELTWVIKDLVSDGEVFAGGTRVVNYTGGTIALYCDPSKNGDFGTNPPNATAPSTFEDGNLILIGQFEQFQLFYIDAHKVGAYQGVITFTQGPGLPDLPDPNGIVFAGTIGPELDPNIPEGYDQEAVGQIIAPLLCSVKGSVEVCFVDPLLNEPLEGVQVHLIDGMGVERETLTDENGDYCFIDVAGESLQVSIIPPLGYTPSSPIVLDLVCTQVGDTAFANYCLDQGQSEGVGCTIGFWKHQFCSALEGKTIGVKFLEAELLDFLDELQTHFGPHFDLFDDITSMETAKALLDVQINGKKKKQDLTSSVDQLLNGKRHFLSLLFCVISGRLATYDVISADGATIGQAITYIAQLLSDGDPDNDEFAKDIADAINNNQTVAAGVIPLGTPDIAYAPGAGNDVPGLGLVHAFGNYPNPFNPTTTITYELSEEAVVHVGIYDVRGRRITELVSGELQRGLKTFVWDGRDHSGRPVASGIYFTRLRVGNETLTKRMVLIR